jgi:hypothetical protein
LGACGLTAVLSGSQFGAELPLLFDLRVTHDG